jgi:hypothetical protein
VRRDGHGGIVLSRPDGLGVGIGPKVLHAPEAVSPLADGLSTNPAVTTAAGELLRPYLARASRKSSRRHKVNRSGTTHTFHSLRGFHLVTGIVLVVFGIGLLVGEAAALAYPHSSWAAGDNTTWDYIWGAGLGLLCTWLGVRLVRVGVHITAEKMTNRGYFVTRTVKPSEIRAITLQPQDNGEGQLRWIPEVELTSGKSFSIASFDCGPARRPPKPEMAATIEDVRTLLGVKTPDPGEPSVRHSDGNVPSPPLQADRSTGGDEEAKAPAAMSSPLPEPQEEAPDAAAKAKWATIWFLISLVVTAGSTAVFAAGVRYTSERPTDWFFFVAWGGLCSAWVAWRARKNYRKIDRLRRLEAGLANARDSTASPTDDRGKHPAIG